jgi:hypothetical protein
MIDGISRLISKIGKFTTQNFLEAKMVEKVSNKEVDVQMATEADNPEGEPKVTKKNLLKVAEVRMVLYVVPAAIIIWIFSYFWQKYVQTHFLDLFH